MHRRDLLALALLCACGKSEPEAPGFTPELYCPGTAGCETAEGNLRAGAARIDVTPTCFETWTDVDGNHEYRASTDTFFDCGCDRLCPGDDGYTQPDEGEGDGVFQAVWIAGFQQGRAMTGARDASLGWRGEGDGLSARALVVERGETRLAIVAVDGFGWMNPFVRDVRDDIAAAGIDVDHVIVHSSHSHSSPDTLGIYGPSLNQSGIIPSYVAQVRASLVEVVGDAVDALEPASLSLGSVDISTYHTEKGVRNVNNDTRDPFVLDETLAVAQFDADNGESIATVVNYASHPEASAGEHTVVSADFVHAMRLTIEDGVTWGSYSRPGIGGTALLLNGAVGGMQTPLRIEVVDPDGNAFQSSSFDKADTVGSLLGEMALDAVEDASPVADPALSFRMQSLYLPIDNTGFQAMFLIGVLDREAYNYDADAQIDEDNVPELLTEMDVIQLGPLSMLTVPGELLPELAIGGYDGSHVNSPEVELIAADNPLPPDLDAAPAGPYLKEVLGAEHSWIIGLGNDEVGYIVPEYDFVLHDGAPYILQPDGDHYEETNSLGPRTAGLVQSQAEQLIAWQPSEP
ncbi:MAG: hypothetical protein EP330_13710 [Deltaproteobacteria bacterium]|nr:MAG: hypothetical protein EP330_13710 [Deltaproteobacteria bacterium]